MRLIFMGTPEFSVPSLEALCSAGHEVVLAVTQPDRAKNRGKNILPTPVKLKAMELGIPIYQPERINTEETVKIFSAYDADLAVVIAYGQILRPNILELPKFGCVNIHASLLPKWRGPAPINRAIVNGDRMTGITIMQMDRELDAGDILKTKDLAIESHWDSVILYEELSRCGAHEIVEVVANYGYYYRNRISQAHDEATYAPLLRKEEGRIDWSGTSLEILNQIRGLKPWPMSYTDYRGMTLKIHEAEDGLVKTDVPGVIFRCDPQGIFVGTGDGSLKITKLQFPNKKAMAVSEFLKGNQIEIGTKLDEGG